MKKSIRAALALSLVLLCTIAVTAQAQVAEQPKQATIADSGFACVPALQTTEVNKPANMLAELTTKVSGNTQRAQMIADLRWLVESSGTIKSDLGKSGQATATFAQPGTYRVALIREDASGVVTGLKLCKVNVIAQRVADR